MTQSVDGVLDELLNACYSIYGAALDEGLGEYAGMWNDGTTDRTLVVVEGLPGNYMPDVIVAVGAEVRQPVERPTMGPNRSREISAEVDVVFSVALPGAGKAATDARRVVNAAVVPFSDYFRVAGNEVLNGACRDAYVSKLSGPEILLAKNPDGGIWGRIAEITATVTAAIRT